MWSLAPDSIAAIMDDPDALVAYVRDNVRPGDIILLHVMYQGGYASRQALPRILEGIAGDDYRFVTVSQLPALRGA